MEYYNRLRCWVLLICTLLIITANAQDTSWYSDEKTEFVLTTADQILGLRSLVNGGNSFEGKTIVLGNDIDISNFDWIEPIGISRIKCFSGCFDGNGYTIKYKIYREYVAGGFSDYKGSTVFWGLFGYITNATIKELTVSGSIYLDVALNHLYSLNCGGIVGLASNSLIMRCKNQVSINAYEASSYRDYTGGICGKSVGTPIILCTNDASISNKNENTQYVGGICGYTDALITKSENSGILLGGPGKSAGGTNLGGIVGFSSDSILYSRNIGGCSASSWSLAMGGIAGSANYIYSCYVSTSQWSRSGRVIWAASCAPLPETNEIVNCYSLSTSEQMKTSEFMNLLNAGDSVWIGADGVFPVVRGSYNEESTYITKVIATQTKASFISNADLIIGKNNLLETGFYFTTNGEEFYIPCNNSSTAYLQSDLLPNSSYLVRWYAKDKEGKEYFGIKKKFFTKEFSAETYNVQSVGVDKAILNGMIDSDTITRCGFVLKEDNSENTDTIWVDNKSQHPSITVGTLKSNTCYSYNTIFFVGDTLFIGNEVHFKTKLITTLKASFKTDSSAMLYAQVGNENVPVAFDYYNTTGIYNKRDIKQLQLGKQIVDVDTDELITFYDPWGTNSIIDNSSYNSQSLTVFRPAKPGYKVEITFQSIALNQYSTSFFLYINLYNGIADENNKFSFATSTSDITSSSSLSGITGTLLASKLNNSNKPTMPAVYTSTTTNGALSVGFMHRNSNTCDGWVAKVRLIKADGENPTLEEISTKKPDILRSSVAYVQDGLATAMVEGLVEGNEYQYRAVCTVNETETYGEWKKFLHAESTDVKSINIPDTLDIAFDDTMKISREILPSYAIYKLEWKSTKESVVVVDSTGTIISKMPGESDIMLTDIITKQQSKCHVMVSPFIDKDSIRYCATIINKDSIGLKVVPCDTLYKGDIRIPKEVRYKNRTYPVIGIDMNAFNGCLGLESITLENNEPLVISANYFSDSVYNHTLLKVPLCCIPLYKAAEGWNKFVHISDGFDVGNTFNAYIPRNSSGSALATFMLTDKDNSIVSVGDGSNAAITTTITGNLSIPSSVVGPGNTIYQVKSIANNAFKVSNVTSVEIGEGITSIGKEAFYSSKITSIKIPETVQKIDPYAFMFSELSTINWPESVTIIDTCMFYCCAKLKSISIPQSVTKIHPEAFMGCSILSNVEIVGNGLKCIGEAAFAVCKQLPAIKIPESVIEIGSGGFGSCDNLTSVTIGVRQPLSIEASCFTNAAKSVLYVPKGCKQFYASTDYWKDFARIVEPKLSSGDSFMASIIVDDESADATFIVADSDNNYVCVGNGEPSSIDDWTEGNIVIPHTVVGSDGIEYQVKGLSDMAFFGCYAINSITMPEGITNIGNTAFYQCTELTSVSLPESLQSIGEEAFLFCENLPEVIIPQNVTSIGLSAFYGCDNLTEVTVAWTEPIAIDEECFSNAANATLYVPFGTKAAYKAATGWKEFGKIVDGSENALAVNDTIGRRGGQIILPVLMNNTEDITTITFKLIMPSGFSLNECTLTDRKGDHIIYPEPQQDGSYLITAFSINNQRFKGNEGSVMNLTINIDGDVEPDDYSVIIKDIELSTEDFPIYPIQCSSILSIDDFMVGDANGNGEVTPYDAVLAIKYYLGRTLDTFWPKAANVNGDKKENGEENITPFDAVSIIKIYLENSRNNNNSRRVMLFNDEKDPQ